MSSQSILFQAIYRQLLYTRFLCTVAKKMEMDDETVKVINRLQQSAQKILEVACHSVDLVLLSLSCATHCVISCHSVLCNIMLKSLGSVRRCSSYFKPWYCKLMTVT